MLGSTLVAVTIPVAVLTVGYSTHIRKKAQAAAGRLQRATDSRLQVLGLGFGAAATAVAAIAGAAMAAFAATTTNATLASVAAITSVGVAGT
jgi:hypothetical protein